MLCGLTHSQQLQETHALQRGQTSGEVGTGAWQPHSRPGGAGHPIGGRRVRKPLTREGEPSATWGAAGRAGCW